MVVLFILTLIPLVLSLFNYINDTFLFVGLFALDFIVVGIASTKAMKPLLSFRDVIRQIKLIIPFGLIFSLISTAIVYYMKMTVSSILVFLSIITIIVLVIALVRNKTTIHKIENPEEYNEKHLIRIIYVLAIFCVVSYIGMEIPPFSVIPLWFGLCIPFICLLPGYLGLNILNPYKDAIRLLERLGISVFVSLVITSIIGLILVQIEHFLNMRHVSLVLVVITLVIFLPLYYIKIKEKKKQILFNDNRLNKIFVIMTIIAIIAVGASGILVTSGNYNNAENNPGSLFQGNTTFEIKGVHETLGNDGYYNFTSGEDLNLTVSITNNENKDMTYKLKIDVVNDTDEKTIDEQSISLKNSETKNIETNLTMTNGQKDIRFTLYDDNNKPYKIRHLYVNVNEDY
ncbi:MAG: hypothetical protein BZ135_03780 [Methanosphaera sp. rholeuAM6]|nr:MAG: hypothetical protein BZ135_03780 [Methanosphaera sp. rholeuAM6]